MCSVLNAFTAASVAALTNKYYLSLGGGTLNQYLLFVVIDLLFFICAFIYLTSGLIVAWKVKSPEHRYKGENLFFFGQIISKLNTTSKTMTLICITLVLAIFMFIAAPILTGWASGYLICALCMMCRYIQDIMTYMKKKICRKTVMKLLLSF